MDDFVSTFLSSSSWSDVTSPENLSWVGTSALQANSTLQSLVGSESYRIINEQNSTMCMISSGEIIQTVPIHESNLCGIDEDASNFVGENLKYAVNRDMLSLESQLQQGSSDNISLPTPQNGIHRRFTLPGSLEGNEGDASFATDCNGNFASEQFSLSLSDSHSTSTIPQLWPSSCSSIHSPAMRQNNIQIMGLQQGQGFLDNGANTVDGTFGNNEISQLGCFPGASIVDEESPKSHIPTLTPISGTNMTRDIGTQPNDYQMTHSTNGKFATMTQAQCSSGGANGSNGNVKTRMRARRGQATDPHSIAERLRREKIADRMKNLQELIPNSNKADKASMLDEIIDYVKFLQLQVKVLSMSRLGATGAVVPLITDVQSEGSSNMLLSPSAEFAGTDISDSEDSVAFEQEVVKLLESNLTTAMQFLQNKGLCLMPVALAAAISARKGLSSAIPMERQKPDSSPEVISGGSEVTLNEILETKQLQRSCNGSVVTLDSAQNPSSNTMDLKPEA